MSRSLAPHPLCLKGENAGGSKPDPAKQATPKESNDPQIAHQQQHHAAEDDEDQSRSQDQPLPAFPADLPVLTRLPGVQ
jgi:hypothetical protein